MRPIPFLSIVTALSLLFSAGYASIFEDTGILPVDKAFEFTSEEKQGKILLNWSICSTCYLYKEKITVAALGEGLILSAIEFPDSQPKNDLAFGLVEVFHDSLELSISHNSPSQAASIVVGYQGCDENTGICYAPQKREITISSQDALVPKNAVFSFATWQNYDGISKILNSQDSRILSLLFFLFVGILLAFTPCIYPMYPILSGIILGRSTDSNPVNTRTALFIALSYVLGIAFVYASIGVLSALLGKQLTTFFQQWQFLSLTSVILVIFASSMYGLFEIKIPGAAYLQAKIGKITSSNTAGGVTAFCVGLLSALILSPCVTAPMVATIVYIAEQGDVIFGGSALFLMGIGAGIPLILFAIGLGKVLPRSGLWMNEVKIIMATAILLLAVKTITPVLPLLLTNGLYLIIAIGYLNHIAHNYWNHQSYAVLLFWRTTIIFLVALPLLYQVNRTPTQSVDSSPTQKTSGFYSRLTPVSSIEDVKNEVLSARRQGRETFLYFHADWCTSCRQLEKNVFAEQQVLSALDGMHLLGWDLSEYNSRVDKELGAEGIVGPPIMLFFTKESGGTISLQEASILVGVVSESDILEKINSL